MTCYLRGGTVFVNSFLSTHLKFPDKTSQGTKTSQLAQIMWVMHMFLQKENLVDLAFYLDVNLKYFWLDLHFLNSHNW